MRIPFDTWDMQSMRENNLFDKTIDLQMTLNCEKTQQNILAFFFRHLGRENQNSKLIALKEKYLTVSSLHGLNFPVIWLNFEKQGREWRRWVIFVNSCDLIHAIFTYQF